MLVRLKFLIFLIVKKFMNFKDLIRTAYLISLLSSL